MYAWHTDGDRLSPTPAVIAVSVHHLKGVHGYLILCFHKFRKLTRDLKWCNLKQQRLKFPDFLSLLCVKLHKHWLLHFPSCNLIVSLESNMKLQSSVAKDMKPYSKSNPVRLLQQTKSLQRRANNNNNNSHFWVENWPFNCIVEKCEIMRCVRYVFISVIIFSCYCKIQRIWGFYCGYFMYCVTLLASLIFTQQQLSRLTDSFEVNSSWHFSLVRPNR